MGIQPYVRAVWFPWASTAMGSSAIISLFPQWARVSLLLAVAASWALGSFDSLRLQGTQLYLALLEEMMAKGITKVKSFYKSQQAKGGIRPIVREKTNSDDIAEAGLRLNSKKRIVPTQGKQGKRGTFDPKNNKKFS